MQRFLKTIQNLSCWYSLDIVCLILSAVADILLRQRQAKILVGDPHQQIYAFRGAVNAMQQIDCTHTFYLTQVNTVG